MGTTPKEIKTEEVVAGTGTSLLGKITSIFIMNKKEEWRVVSTFAKSGERIFFIQREKDGFLEGFMIINPKMVRKKLMTKKELEDFGENLKIKSNKIKKCKRCLVGNLGRCIVCESK